MERWGILLDHRGKVAVITGAASGLGLEIARACAARGMKLALADIQDYELDRIAGELQKKGSGRISSDH
jgi:NAD(P)-dependent dehydrogenase (short-subunit alcohol dehydrogenase family)